MHRIEDVVYACRTLFGGVMQLRVHVFYNENPERFAFSCRQALLDDGVHPATVKQLEGMHMNKFDDAWTWGLSPPILFTEPRHVRVVFDMDGNRMCIPVGPQLHETPLGTLSALHAFLEIHGFEMTDMVNPACFYTLDNHGIRPLTTRKDLYTHGMFIGKVRHRPVNVTFRSLYCEQY